MSAAERVTILASLNEAHGRRMKRVQLSQAIDAERGRLGRSWEDGRQHRHLTLPCSIPWTNHFWKMRKKSSGGTIATSPAAFIPP